MVSSQRPAARRRSSSWRLPTSWMPSGSRFSSVRPGIVTVGMASACHAREHAGEPVELDPDGGGPKCRRTEYCPAVGQGLPHGRGQLGDPCYRSAIGLRGGGPALREELPAAAQLIRLLIFPDQGACCLVGHDEFVEPGEFRKKLWLYRSYDLHASFRDCRTRHAQCAGHHGIQVSDAMVIQNGDRHGRDERGRRMARLPSAASSGLAGHPRPTWR